MASKFGSITHIRRVNLAKYSYEELFDAVADANTMAEVASKLGASYGVIKYALKRYGIRYDHFKGIRRQPVYGRDSTPVRGYRRVSGKSLRRVLADSGVPEICSSCGLREWLGKRLRLDVDHKDGDSANNCFDNLQYLCPNCHRLKTQPYQQDFASCSDCGGQVLRDSKRCNTCENLYRRTEPSRRRKRPAKEVLEELVWKVPLIQIAKQFGVSGKAVEKWCVKYGLTRPPRGFWSKKRNVA